MGALRMEQLSGMNLHYQHHSLEYFLDQQVALGIKNVELWGASPHLYVDDASPERLHYVRKAIKSRGLHLICYTPETVVYPNQYCGRGGTYPLAQPAIPVPGNRNRCGTGLWTDAAYPGMGICGKRQGKVDALCAPIHRDSDQKGGKGGCYPSAGALVPHQLQPD